MRFDGTIKTWNEAKGFGFITPANGGQDVFVHVSALPRGSGTPRVGQAFSFEIELNREGKKRAVRVREAGRRAEPHRAHHPRERAARSPVAAVVGVVLVLAMGVAAYSKLSGPIARIVAPDSAAAQEPAAAADAPTLPTTYKCDGRTHCSQMTSCKEAKFFLKNCPGVQMDGNHDGVPCEQQWCTSWFAK